MIRLSAFADEISPDLDEQIAVLRSEGIRHLDLRGVWNTNVLDLSDEQVEHIKRTLDAHGIGVAAIASPLGKAPIDAPRDEQLRRVERAITLAQRFETPYIRIFSFYPPAAAQESQAIRESTVDPATYRDAVLTRMREMTELARAAGLTLLHENEKDIYGDTIARCVDLLHSIDDPHFRAIHDPANFIQCGQAPYPEGYEAVRPWLTYMHVKDAQPDGSVTRAGEGAGCWPELLQRLRADGFDGFFSLEPHLAAAGRFQGFSGPDLFRQASQALQQLLRTMEWAYA